MVSGATGKLLEREAGSRGTANFFDAKEQAIQHHEHQAMLRITRYNKAKPEAEKKLEKIHKELLEIQKKHKAGISYGYEGECSSIYNEGIRISTVVDGFEYEKLLTHNHL